MLDVVRSIDGVVAADSVVDGTARLVGRDGKLVDDNMEQTPPIGMAWPSSDDLNPLHLVAGTRAERGRRGRHRPCVGP